MAEVKKTVSDREKQLIGILRSQATPNGGSLTIAEIAQKMDLKESSVTTMLSQTRAKFKLAGKDFKPYEPKKNRGGGRVGNATNLVEFLDELGDFDFGDEAEADEV